MRAINENTFMDSIIGSLESLISNARKSLGRPYSAETISNKRTEIRRFQKELEDGIVDLRLSKEQAKDLTDKFRTLKEEAIDILEQHTKKGILIQTRTEATLMVKMDLNELSSISKLIPVFTGKKDELHSFVTNLNMVFKTIKEEKQQFFFDFVFESRLDLKVQNRVKRDSMPTNVSELINILKKTYKPVRSANNVLNELTHITQKGESVTNFAGKIESLISELNEIQISEIGEEGRSSIIKANNMIAFNSFKNGLKDQQAVTTIEASRVKAFTEALEIAEEAVVRVKQNQILYHGQSKSL